MKVNVIIPVPGALSIQALTCPCAQCLLFIWYPLHNNKGPPSADLGKKEFSSPSPGHWTRQPGHGAQEQSSLGRVQEDNRMTFSSSWHPAPPFIPPMRKPQDAAKNIYILQPNPPDCPPFPTRKWGQSSYFSMVFRLKTLFNPQKVFCKTSYVFTL